MELTLNPSELRDRQHFNQIAEHYARKDFALSSKEAREYHSNFTLEPVLPFLNESTCILDIGCGPATAAQLLKGRYGRYIGVDYSEELIALAREFHKENKRAEFIAGNVRECSLGVHVADVVLSMGLLHHVSDFEALFNNLRKSAKPGAFLVALEPAGSNPFLEFMRWARKKMDPLYSADQRAFSVREIKEILTQNGFKDIEITPFGLFHPPFAQIVLPLGSLGKWLAHGAVKLDRFLDQVIPQGLRWMCWNLRIIARFTNV